MAKPATRQDFANFCLRKLGAPVIKINVDPDQVNDRIDEALNFYWDNHYDGTEKLYYKYAFQQTDLDNGYIQLPESIIGVVDIFPITGINTVNSMFDIRYQIALNDLYTLTNQSLVPYYQAMQAIQLYEIILVGRKPIRYNRNNNRLYIDMDYQLDDDGNGDVNVGDFVIVETYAFIDPDDQNQDNSRIWNDKWLQRYATALIKKQWGDNLSKFSNIAMPGGTTFNAQAILQSAENEIATLEAQLFDQYQAPLDWIIG